MHNLLESQRMRCKLLKPEYSDLGCDYVVTV